MIFGKTNANLSESHSAYTQKFHTLCNVKLKKNTIHTKRKGMDQKQGNKTDQTNTINISIKTLDGRLHPLVVAPNVKFFSNFF